MRFDSTSQKLTKYFNRPTKIVNTRTLRRYVSRAGSRRNVILAYGKIYDTREYNKTISKKSKKSSAADRQPSLNYNERSTTMKTYRTFEKVKLAFIRRAVFQMFSFGAGEWLVHHGAHISMLSSFRTIKIFRALLKFLIGLSRSNIVWFSICIYNWIVSTRVSLNATSELNPEWRSRKRHAESRWRRMPRHNQAIRQIIIRHMYFQVHSLVILKVLDFNEYLTNSSRTMGHPNRNLARRYLIKNYLTDHYSFMNL